MSRGNAFPNPVSILIPALLAALLVPARPADGLAFTGSGLPWPGAYVPYSIADDLFRTARICESMRLWEEVTPIRFLPLSGSSHICRTEESPDQEPVSLSDYSAFDPSGAASPLAHPNFVLFRDTRVGDSWPCTAAVGMRDIGAQTVVLSDNVGFCQGRDVLHEIGHAIGFVHEETRGDRDSYVYLAEPDSPPPSTALTEYDYHSIMHKGTYGRYAGAWRLGEWRVIRKTWYDSEGRPRDCLEDTAAFGFFMPPCLITGYANKYADLSWPDIQGTRVRYCPLTGWDTSRDCPEEPEVETVYQPAVTIAPATADLGNLAWDGSPELHDAFVITNDSPDSQRVHRLAVSGPQAGHFNVLVGPPDQACDPLPYAPPPFDPPNGAGTPSPQGCARELLLDLPLDPGQSLTVSIQSSTTGFSGTELQATLEATIQGFGWKREAWWHEGERILVPEDGLQSMTLRGYLAAKAPRPALAVTPARLRLERTVPFETLPFRLPGPTPPPRVVPAASIPSCANEGIHVAGARHRRVMLVHNTGQVDEMLDDLELRGRDEASFDVLCADDSDPGPGLWIAPGDLAILIVEFDPQVQDSTFTAQLGITGVAGSFEVALDGHATVATPRIAFTRESIDFGVVQGDSPGFEEQVVTLANTGTGDATITALPIYGSADFTATFPTGPGVPFVLPAGTSRAVVVRLTPSGSGYRSARLSVAWTGMPLQIFAGVEMTGYGIGF
ncbi:MAG: choice-of-anchor D domain-containing protein [bacterium]|nr:choice-of-anchor D domain-containing protein [bacterium]